MNTMTRGEAFATIQEIGQRLRKAHGLGRRKEEELRAARELLLAVHDSDSWRLIENPKTCKIDPKTRKALPGTGRPYKGFGECLAAELNVSRSYIWKLKEEAEAERNLQARTESALAVPGPLLRVLADLDPEDQAVVADRLKAERPDLTEMGQDDFRDYIDNIEEPLEAEDTEEMSAEQKAAYHGALDVAEQKAEKREEKLTDRRKAWRLQAALAKWLPWCASTGNGEVASLFAAARERLEAKYGKRPERATRTRAG